MIVAVRILPDFSNLQILPVEPDDLNSILFNSSVEFFCQYLSDLRYYPLNLLGIHN